MPVWIDGVILRQNFLTMNQLLCSAFRWLLCLVIVFNFSALELSGQVFQGAGGPIPDNGNAIDFQLDVNGVNQTFLDTTYGLESVTINVAHTYDADLHIVLIAPSGASIVLASGNGGGGHNFVNTVFTDTASTSIVQGEAPFTGFFQPIERIGNVNNGGPADGIWILRILDTYPGADEGVVYSWGMKFSDMPGMPYQFESSNLPLVIIDTYGQTIPDDPKVLVGMKIIDNGPGLRNHLTDLPVYDNHAGIEIRGSSSQSFPKKSYGFETWDAQGNEVETGLLGMPEESDWILNANYTDKTLMRNVLAYQTWTDMGYYATRYRFVEVFINGAYKGVYIFSEKIKRDKNRVNINKLEPGNNSGDPLTGGYIVKIDKSTGSGGDGWASAFPPPNASGNQYIFFQYEYPKQEDITQPQKDYISDYIDQFETVLDGPDFTDPDNGWRKYAIENTFIDYFLVNEASKNVDGLRLSTFVHKERDSKGGKLRMGPVWDYDLAWHNADYCGGDQVTGWAYQFPCADDWWQVPFWWSRLLQDTTFQNRMKCRWTYFRNTILSDAAVGAYIDSLTLLLEESRVRNFETWPIIGIYVWPNPQPIPQSWEAEVASLKSWISTRLAWLDANLPGTCYYTALPTVSGARLTISPNPVGTAFRVDGLHSGEQVEQLLVFDAAGAIVAQYQGGTVTTLNLRPGYYYTRIITRFRTEVVGLVVQ